METIRTIAKTAWYLASFGLGVSVAIICFAFAFRLIVEVIKSIRRKK